jgi:hypothetical protein
MPSINMESRSSTSWIRPYQVIDGRQLTALSPGQVHLATNGLSPGMVRSFTLLPTRKPLLIFSEQLYEPQKKRHMAKKVRLITSSSA